MMFSVIVPTCNRNALLSNCLDKLAPVVQAVSPDLYEVIITDDSREGIAAGLIQNKYGWTKWVKGPARGPAANRNNGAKYAKSEWLVFIDDDCLPDNNLLIEYLKAIKANPDSLAFEGAIFPDDEKLLKKDMAECPINTTGGFFWSANICINKNLFKVINGFDERFKIAAQEDQQLKIDIENASSVPIFFIKQAFVIHPVRIMHLSKQLAAIPIVSKNFCLYACKNREKLGYNSFFKFLKSQILFHLKNSLLTIKNLQFKKTFLGIAWLLFGIPLNAFYFLTNSKK